MALGSWPIALSILCQFCELGQLAKNPLAANWEHREYLWVQDSSWKHLCIVQNRVSWKRSETAKEPDRKISFPWGFLTQWSLFRAHWYNQPKDSSESLLNSSVSQWCKSNQKDFLVRLFSLTWCLFHNIIYWIWQETRSWDCFRTLGSAIFIHL